MNTGEIHHALSAVWLNSDPTSKYGAVFDKNMDDSSFNSLYESLMKTINLPNNAFFGSIKAIETGLILWIMKIIIKIQRPIKSVEGLENQI